MTIELHHPPTARLLENTAAAPLAFKELFQPRTVLLQCASGLADVEKQRGEGVLEPPIPAGLFSMRASHLRMPSTRDRPSIAPLAAVTSRRTHSAGCASSSPCSERGEDPTLAHETIVRQASKRSAQVDSEFRKTSRDPSQSSHARPMAHWTFKAAPVAASPVAAAALCQRPSSLNA